MPPARFELARAAWAAGIVAVGLLAACATAGGDATPAAGEPAGAVASALSKSAARAGVPRDLLLAIAKVEGGLALPAMRLGIDVDNEVPAAGPLQLRRGKLDTLRRGAELAGVSEVELRVHTDLALEAGALVLAELGAKTGAREGDLASWSAAVEEMSGFADEAHREHYVHQVFATLARGGRFAARGGEIVVLPQHDLPPSLTLDVSDKLKVLSGQAEYEGAEWIPTSCANKCNPGRGGFEVELIVVHDTEGNWNASVATLQNDPGKSVQYIIDVDGRIGQFITEDTTGWHAGNFDYNQRSIGIEHVGYATEPFAEAEYVASAKLVDHLAAKYRIPRDRAHVIGHDQIPNGNAIDATSPPCPGSPKECQSNRSYGGANRHTDPGIWEWATYMPRFGGTAKCNDVGERWTCSHDRTKAFRCADGEVELEICDGAGGCEPGERGDDGDAGDAGDGGDGGDAGDGGVETVAVCHVAPKTEPPPPPTKATPASEHLEPAPPAPPTSSDESGCAMGRRPLADGASHALAVLAAVAVVTRRRRRPPV